VLKLLSDFGAFPTVLSTVNLVVSAVLTPVLLSDSDTKYTRRKSANPILRVIYSEYGVISNKAYQVILLRVLLVKLYQVPVLVCITASATSVIFNCNWFVLVFMDFRLVVRTTSD
jgi:hypothetical protein